MSLEIKTSLLLSKVAGPQRVHAGVVVCHTQERCTPREPPRQETGGGKGRKDWAGEGIRLLVSTRGEKPISHSHRSQA